ncbi:hypothetical protein ES707_20204 [subsurface metagenome]
MAECPHTHTQYNMQYGYQYRQIDNRQLEIERLAYRRPGKNKSQCEWNHGERNRGEQRNNAHKIHFCKEGLGITMGNRELRGGFSMIGLFFIVRHLKSISRQFEGSPHVVNIHPGSP